MGFFLYVPRHESASLLIQNKKYVAHVNKKHVPRRSACDCATLSRVKERHTFTQIFIFLRLFIYELGICTSPTNRQTNKRTRPIIWPI